MYLPLEPLRDSDLQGALAHVAKAQWLEKYLKFDQVCNCDAVDTHLVEGIHPDPVRIIMIEECCFQ